MICDGQQIGTAQIVGRSDVVLTVAHNLYDANCKPKHRNCKVEGLFADFSEQIVLATAETGWDCGKSERTLDLLGDWAIVATRRPIRDIAPYTLPSAQFYPTVKRTIVQISKAVRNFRFPSIDTCLIVSTDTRFASGDSAGVGTNCGSDRGSSGSAQLVEVSNGYEIAMIHAGGPLEAQNGQWIDPTQARFNSSVPIRGALFDRLVARTSTSSGRLKITSSSTQCGADLKFILPNIVTFDFTEYDKDKAFNVSIPLEGAFLHALRKAVGLSPALDVEDSSFPATGVQK